MLVAVVVGSRCTALLSVVGVLVSVLHLQTVSSFCRVLSVSLAMCCRRRVGNDLDMLLDIGAIKQVLASAPGVLYNVQIGH